MTMNTPYLGTPSDSTTVYSDISVSGTADLGVVDVTSTLDVAGAATYTSTLTVAGASTFDSSVTVGTLGIGVGKGNLSVISTSMQSVVALTVNDLESLQTTFACNWAKLGDVVIGAPVDSDLSNGIAFNTYVSANSVVAIRFSNCSATEAKIVAQSWRFAMLRFV